MSEDDVEFVKKQNKSVRNDFFSILIVLAAALLFAVLISMFVFRSYQVDGPSMENTLQNNDKLIVWKLPVTWSKITGHQYVPKRGDIIVFKESGLSQFGQSNTKDLIKRVIGLPGDKVVVAHGIYMIYNKNHPKGFDPDKTLPYGKNIPYTSGNETFKLGPNQLFVSGDNRPYSLDSRDFGPIKTSQVLGKLVLRFYPLNNMKIF